ncbi:MAG: hypothetical protein AABZ74_18425 [Cyanobacteriota bacterium]
MIRSFFEFVFSFSIITSMSTLSYACYKWDKWNRGFKRGNATSKNFNSAMKWSAIAFISISISFLSSKIVDGSTQNTNTNNQNNKVINNSQNDIRQEPAKIIADKPKDLQKNIENTIPINNTQGKVETYENNDFSNLVFIGAIDNQYKIHMKLTKIADNITGTYYYDIYKKDIKMIGKITNNEFIINEFEPTGKGYIIGIFKGIYRDSTSLSGMWSKPDNSKTLSFFVSSKS